MGGALAGYLSYYQNMGLTIFIWFFVLCCTLGLRLYFQKTLAHKLEIGEVNRVWFDATFAIAPSLNGFVWGGVYCLIATLDNPSLLLGASFVICSVAFHGFTYLTHSKLCYLSYFISVFVLPVFYHFILDSNYVVGTILVIGCTHFLFYNRLLYDRSTALLTRHFDNLEFIERQKNIEKKLKYLSEIDPLTQINNRSSYEKKLKATRYRAQITHKPVNIALIDIDFFKLINDQFGHIIGDHVLKQVVMTIDRLTDSSFTLGRYGGEEFILFNNQQEHDAFALTLEEIRLSIEQMPLIDIPSGLSVTVSIGAISSYTNSSQESLISNADSCLYEAKTAGRNRIVLHSYGK